MSSGDGKVAVSNVVGGREVPAADGRTMDLVDPSTGEVFGTAPLSGPEDVDAAVRAAADAFEGWRDSTPSERQRALLKFADALEDRAEDIVAAECQNTGKPIELTRTEEMPPAIDQIRFFAGAARLLEGRSAGEYMAGHTSMIRREPLGIVAGICPWNYPLFMAMWKVGPALAAGDVMTLDHVLSGSLAPQRITAGMLSVFAGIAVLLAVIGIYGVMSYSVTQRTHEIGIRMALGAQSGDVLRLVVRQGMFLAGGGIAIGLLAAWLLTRLMTNLLFGVRPDDPLTFGFVCAVLAGVAALASFLPARRAASTDPVTTLRHD